MATSTSVTWELLSTINEAQSTSTNKETLDSPAIGGIAGLAEKLNVNAATGLTTQQVEAYRALFGTNSMPATKMKGYFEILLGALSDTILLVLLAAAAVSFGLGYWQDPMFGWIEGAAIFIAVFLVSNISAFNDYSKELQFRALEASSNQDERTSVLRNGTIDLINPADLVVGDILVFQGGDKVIITVLNLLPPALSTIDFFPQITHSFPKGAGRRGADRPRVRDHVQRVGLDG